MPACSAPKVFVTRNVPYIIEKLQKAGVKVSFFAQEAEKIPQQELLQQVKDCDGILCLVTDRIDAEVIESAGKNLKTVSTMSVGYNHIDIEACKKHDISVGNTPGVLDTSTAETAISLTFAAKRKIAECIDSARTGTWGDWQPFQYCGSDVTGSTVGIIGLGRIGATYARMMKFGFQCKILYTGNNRKPDEVVNPLGAEFCSMDDLLERSDIISIHCPLNTSTEDLFNHETFSKMKSSAVLINTARGPIVNQTALYKALSTNQIAAAGLDVTDPEPLPTENELFKLPNCTILPHIGSATVSTREAMADIAVENLMAGLSERPLLHALVDNKN